MAIANMPSGVAAMAFGALGPNFSTTSACASAGHAIGEAAEMIRRGDAEVMLAGGCEASGLRRHGGWLRGHARALDAQ